MYLFHTAQHTEDEMHKIIGVLGALLFLIIGSSALFHWGKVTGSAEVTKEWNQEKKQTEEYIHTLALQYVELKRVHAVESQNLRNEIVQSRNKYEADLIDIRNQYSDRLLSSEQRANLYKRQAESGTIEHRGLADYAAELDRSLEEGRHLVRELRTALGQREREIGILSTQIHTDRNLLERADLIHGNN